MVVLCRSWQGQAELSKLSFPVRTQIGVTIGRGNALALPRVNGDAEPTEPFGDLSLSFTQHQSIFLDPRIGELLLGEEAVRWADDYSAKVAFCQRARRTLGSCCDLSPDGAATCLLDFADGKMTLDPFTAGPAMAALVKKLPHMQQDSALCMIDMLSEDYMALHKATSEELRTLVQTGDLELLRTVVVEDPASRKWMVRPPLLPLSSLPYLISSPRVCPSSLPSLLFSRVSSAYLTRLNPCELGLTRPMPAGLAAVRGARKRARVQAALLLLPLAPAPGAWRAAVQGPPPTASPKLLLRVANPVVGLPQHIRCFRGPFVEEVAIELFEKEVSRRPEYSHRVVDHSTPVDPMAEDDTQLLEFRSADDAHGLTIPAGAPLQRRLLWPVAHGPQQVGHLLLTCIFYHTVTAQGRTWF